MRDIPSLGFVPKYIKCKFKRRKTNKQSHRRNCSFVIASFPPPPPHGFPIRCVFPPPHRCITFGVVSSGPCPSSRPPSSSSDPLAAGLYRTPLSLGFTPSTSVCMPSPLGSGVLLLRRWFAGGFTSGFFPIRHRVMPFVVRLYLSSLGYALCRQVIPFVIGLNYSPLGPSRFRFGSTRRWRPFDSSCWSGHGRRRDLVMSSWRTHNRRHWVLFIVVRSSCMFVVSSIVV